MALCVKDQCVNVMIAIIFGAGRLRGEKQSSPPRLFFMGIGGAKAVTSAPEVARISLDRFASMSEG
jgi:hypothetical protein